MCAVLALGAEWVLLWETMLGVIVLYIRFVMLVFRNATSHDHVRTFGAMFLNMTLRFRFLFFFRWIRRWFEVEDRVLYCYDAQDQDGSKVKRAAVLYQASVKVSCAQVVPAQTIPYHAIPASSYSPAGTLSWYIHTELRTSVAPCKIDHLCLPPAGMIPYNFQLLLHNPAWYPPLSAPHLAQWCTAVVLCCVNVGEGH